MNRLPVFKSSPKPKVTLVGWTTSLLAHGINRETGPMDVIAIVWKQSKGDFVELEDIINDVAAMTPDQLSDLMVRVMEGVPVVEAVSFNFIIENASISWREQMVRHRVGTKPDARIGADMSLVEMEDLGNVADMSAWSRSMRLDDMSTFADRRAYRTPDSVEAMGEDAIREWHGDMLDIAAKYEKWTNAMGIPREDARDLIPLGATSRLTWTVNLRTLQQLCAKRSCTILQLGLWGPIINGIVEELAAKISPAFRKLVTPPCLKGDVYKGCIFPEDNARRLDGRDANLPVCPLFIGQEQSDIGTEARAQYADRNIRLMDDIDMEAFRRGRYWGRNPWTGETLSEPAAIDDGTWASHRNADGAYTGVHAWNKHFITHPDKE